MDFSWFDGWKVCTHVCAHKKMMLAWSTSDRCGIGQQIRARLSSPTPRRKTVFIKKTTSFLTFANFFFEKTGRNWNPQPDFSSDSWPIFFFIFARSNPSRRLTFLTWSCAVVNVHGFIIKKRANRDWRCSMKPTFLLRTYIISYTISSRLNRHLAAWKVTVQQQSPEPSNIIR